MKIIGINRRFIPAYDPESETDITCVLVAGEIGDYAAYEAVGSPEFTARCGNKLSFEEAKAQFPWIEKKKYRL